MRKARGLPIILLSVLLKERGRVHGAVRETGPWSALTPPLAGKTICERFNSGGRSPPSRSYP
eukprot:8678934-Pyramimonas_sp.AAC.1